MEPSAQVRFVREWMQRKAKEGGFVLLDGGLSSTLEDQLGLDISTGLWSARLLADGPEHISTVHNMFLRAGAQIITTSSYQASGPGFVAAGHSKESASELLRRSVALASEAVTSMRLETPVCPDGAASGTIAHEPSSAEAPAADGAPATVAGAGAGAGARAGAGAGTGQPSADVPPEARVCRAATGSGACDALVAVSIGPYGAYLADGSEYSGVYAATDDELRAFHRARLSVLAAEARSKGHLLACETLPCARDALVLARLLHDEWPEVPAWFSFSCKDARTLHSGDSLTDTVTAVEEIASAQLVAIGVNCVHPAIVLEAVKQLHATPLPAAVSKDYRRRIVVYPNKGEDWDDVAKAWRSVSSAEAADNPSNPATPDDTTLGRMAVEWANAGAEIIGGCCRCGPSFVSILAAERAGTAAT